LAGFKRKSNREKKIELASKDHHVLFGGGLTTRTTYKEVGYYTVGPGDQDIRFDLDYPVESVLISCPSLEIPVCQGDLNYFAVTLLEMGFILHCRVTTDSATITWVTIQGLSPLDDPNA
jgi:hypothetical protein